MNGSELEFVNRYTYCFNSDYGKTTSLKDTNHLYFEYQEGIDAGHEYNLKVRLVSASIPVSWYNCNGYNNNFVYTVVKSVHDTGTGIYTTVTTDYTVALTKSQQNVYSISTNLIAAMLAQTGHICTCTYNYSSNSFTITIDVGSVVNTTITSITISNSSTCIDLFGFDTEVTKTMTLVSGTNYTYTTTQAVDLSYTKVLYIKVDKLINHQVSTVTVDYNETDDYIGIIPVTNNYPGVINYTSNDYINVLNKSFTQTTVCLLDSSGRMISMNNAQWIIVIEIQVYRDKSKMRLKRKVNSLLKNV